MNFLRYLLLETPRMISPLDDIALNTPEGNFEEYMMLNRYVKMNQAEKLEVIGDMILYRAKTEIKTIVFALAAKTKQVCYLMEFEEDTNEKFGRYVFQSFVWVDKTKSAARRLPKDCFFKYVVQIEDVVLTDSIQTWDGKEFWLRRLKESFDMNLFVYYINSMTGDVIKLDRFEQVREFDIKYQIWHHNGLTKLMGISKKPLL
jgi:hypothetical protein